MSFGKPVERYVANVYCKRPAKRDARRSVSSMLHQLPSGISRLLPLLLVLSIPLVAVAQSEQQDTVGKDKVHIDHARIINAEVKDGHEYMYLRDDVELSQDSMYLYCDSARVIDKREVAASGNIVIQRGDSLHVFADTLLYFADTRLADLLGDVALINGKQQLWTTHLSYDLGQNVARYDAPAQLLDSTTQLSSKRGVYWVDTKEALFIDSVVVIDPEFTLISDSMRYNADTRLAKFIAPTRILQEDGELYCESGYYDLLNRQALFTENAQYHKQDEEASADSIGYDGKLRVLSLIGNAKYSEHGRAAAGDSIIYHEMSGDTRIAGNAYFRDSTRTVRSDVITYNRDSKQLGVEGSGMIIDGTRILKGDHMDFDRQSGLGRMEGAVVIEDTVAQTILESDIAEFIQENGFIKAYGSTRPVFKSVVDNDTLYITQDTLVSYEQADSVSGDTIRYMNGYHDVRIFRGTMQGLCDSLAFNGKDSVFMMLGTPILWSDTTQFTADTIDLYVRNKVLDHVVLRTNALIISAVQGTFYNQIKGKQVYAVLDSNRLQSLKVNGNAESIYYVQDDNQAFIGVNRVVASEIFFTFHQGNLDKINFTTKPTGTMMPMDLVEHTQLRLDGFIWRDRDRPKELQDLF